MAWFKMDDGVITHPKFAMITAADMGVWSWGAAWSSRELTNGFIPETVLPLLRGMKANADRLVKAGLWIEVEGGWEFHDWNDYQPTPREVEELREKRKAAGRKGGKLSAQAKAEAKGQASAQANARQMLKQNDSNTSSKAEADSNPVPVPVPVPITSKEVIDPPTPQRGKESDPYPAANKLPKENGRYIYPEPFDAFYATYPHARDAGNKIGSYRSWRTAVKSGTSPDLILAGAEHYASDPNRVDQFTKACTTWLNKQGWLDGPLPARTRPGQPIEDRFDDWERAAQLINTQQLRAIEGGTP